MPEMALRDLSPAVEMEQTYTWQLQTSTCSQDSVGNETIFELFWSNVQLICLLLN